MEGVGSGTFLHEANSIRVSTSLQLRRLNSRRWRRGKVEGAGEDGAAVTQ